MIRLVVADDAPFIREIVRSVLEKAGLSLVGEAADGDEAIAAVTEHRPDVILMDIVMPRKSGIEATKEILKLNPRARVIAFSTADQETMVMNALEAGCCSFLVKPFTGEALLKSIREAMAR